MEKERLAKYLASCGIASRRKCEDLIFAGRVKVNGAVTLLPQTLVNGRDKIMVDESRVAGKEEKVYYLLNKPKGYLCSNLQGNSTKLVTNLFQGVNKRLFTVGRLDRDTTGLLIVTNDGEFSRKVIHPSSNLQKEYVVKTNRDITDKHLKQIAEGAYVEGQFVKPVKVAKVRKGTVKVVVMEGKKREVRQLVENVGIEVIELKRTRLGNLRLGTLPIGAWRPLSEREKELIFE